MGGTTAGALDVISGNTSGGVYLTDSGTSANVVEGDFIGTDFTGTKASWRTALDGVEILGGATPTRWAGRPPGPATSSPAMQASAFVVRRRAHRITWSRGDYIGTDLTGGEALAQRRRRRRDRRRRDRQHGRRDDRRRPRRHLRQYQRGSC